MPQRGVKLGFQPMGRLALESVIHLRGVTKLCNQETNTLNITPNSNINIPVDVSTYLCINTVPRVIIDKLCLTLIKLLCTSVSMLCTAGNRRCTTEIFYISIITPILRKLSGF